MQNWSHKELRARIKRLKKAEKELLQLNPPRYIFGAESDSIRAKLKSVSQVEEVERQLQALKQKAAQYHVSYKETFTAQANARGSMETATIEIKEARTGGHSISEAESLLSQAREMLNTKDYHLATEYATQATQSAAEVKRAAKPQVTIELDTENFSPGEWRAVDLGLTNRGRARAQSIQLRFSSEVEAKWAVPIAELDGGASNILRIELKPRDAGDIPLDVEVSYKDIAGTDYSGVQRFWLKAGTAAEAGKTAADIDLGADLLPQLENYTLTRKIGFGGFADVYLGESAQGQTVAIKIPRLSQYEAVGARGFLSEAELWSKLSKLKNPYIVELYEYGTAPYPWIAMEYMEGGSLRDRMAGLSYKEYLEIAMKLMEALHSAHHHGVIHRDIKPENVLFDNKNTPKLTDWGLGKMLLDASRISVIFRGTLAYSAPEQLAGSRFGSTDWRTDIYQMGMLAYELLTGQLPFAGAEAGTTIARILNDSPPAPGQLKKGVPPELDDAVLRATAKRKEDRFQTMAAFRDRLEQVLRDL